MSVGKGWVKGIITKVLSSVRYIIKLIGSGISRYVHVSAIKPCIAVNTQLLEPKLPMVVNDMPDVNPVDKDPVLLSQDIPDINLDSDRDVENNFISNPEIREESTEGPNQVDEGNSMILRRSQRLRKAPDRLNLLSSAIADQLKGLFVLFAGHFIKNAADLLDSCNSAKSEDLFFDSEEKCLVLLKYVIKTLQIVFLYDSQNFLNKERFETLMQPVVDQLENPLGGIENLKERATELLIPCISQFAVATNDDSLWKLLNYQILLKTRHNDADIRLTALDCLVAMATQLGSSWLPLLAESVPFLAELLEDGDQRIEMMTKEAIRKLEQILGEPLEKYF
ncbi:hypothetical protein ACJJTC_002404 [Scirpophaga incertulas]